MRTATAALACLLALALSACADVTRRSAGGTGSDGGAASCVAPYLDDAHGTARRGRPVPVVAPGGTLPLRGSWYTSTCNDTGGHDPLVALPDVTLTVTFPDGSTAELGPFTPTGDDMGFDATVAVPVGMTRGEVTVSDGRGGAAYTFRVGADAKR